MNAFVEIVKLDVADIVATSGKDEIYAPEE